MNTKPYKFAPYFKPTIWGGNRIAAFKGIATEQLNIGESWEISGVPGHESVTVDRGLVDDVDVGKTLPELIGVYRESLVGTQIYERFGNRFPLLVKFIDSRQNLSIQVHPNDELARRRNFPCGKTEMWYVIKADPGAQIYAGLRRPLTPDEYEHLARRTDCENPFQDVIGHYESHDGDLYFLPAGRLHAIGAGNFLAEIQQASDVTYRVWDFGRKDASGRPRELHIEQARDAIDYRASTESRVSYESSNPTCELIRCPYFRVNRLLVRNVVSIDFKRDSFIVVMCLEGRADVNGVKVRQGETLLVPACANVLDIVGSATFLTATYFTDVNGM